jgi:hypothetical protein
MDLLPSLLLGSPTSIEFSTLRFYATTSESGFSRILSSLVGDPAGKILERNATDRADGATKRTGQIDEEIILAAELIPTTFWRDIGLRRT